MPANEIEQWVLKPLITWLVNRLVATVGLLFGRRKINAKGLRRFLTRLELEQWSPLDKIIKEGSPKDTFLMVGRTCRWLIEQKQHLITEGIDRGMHFKFLILDPEAVERAGKDLDPLELGNPTADLEKTRRILVSICEDAERRRENDENAMSGSLEVKTFGFPIINSFWGLRSSNRLRLLLDFSFGEGQDLKFAQYYDINKPGKQHFCSKLYAYHAGIYEKLDESSTYIAYRDGKVERSNRFISTTIRQDVDGLLTEYSEHEEIRRNTNNNYLHAIAPVFKHQTTPRLEIPPPVSVHLEIVDHCNSHCRHCQRYCWPKHFMPVEEVKGVIDQLRNAQVRSLTLSGGEPSLHEDLEDILHYARKAQMRTGLLTNGLALDDKKIAAIVNNCDWVRFSLNASNSDIYGGVHEKVAGYANSESAFNAARQAIRQTSELSKAKDGICQVGVSFTIQSANIRDVPSMLKLAVQPGSGIDPNRLVFKFAHGQNGYLCSMPDLTWLVNECLKDSTIANIPYLSNFISKYSNLDDIHAGCPLNSYYRDHSVTCHAVFLQTVIDAHGGISPCCFLYHDNGKDTPSSQNYIGKLSESSFMAIWRSENYKQFRQSKTKIDPDSQRECGECTRHYIQNVFLTELFTKYKSYTEADSIRAADLFAKVLRDYPAETVWL